ncbi:MAG: sensor histidine kinase [Bacteroidales bacterium]|nr:sensor histidine kinase [Bacteroidales bacterium]
MLKTLSHKKIAILISIVSAIINILFINFYMNFYEQSPFLYQLLIAMAVFLITYIISYYAIKNYIVLKITPIYKTIQTTQLNKTQKLSFENTENMNILEKTNEEVQEWAKKKTNEIEELKRLEKYRKEYIGNVSHELKTPIFSIQGYILTLLDGGIDDPDINRKYLERADKAINRMISIIKDLEAISRLESGELVLQHEIFDIKMLFAEIFEAQEILAKEKQISLVFNKESDTSNYVHADRKRISQVISNLIVNSIKYGKVGGVTKVGFYDMDSFILVEIKDNGIGMEESHLPRIFERFYRVDKSRSREQGGTGLGLSIVKHIIEGHKQTINVKSKPNEGTSFTFTLDKAMPKSKIKLATSFLD